MRIGAFGAAVEAGVGCDTITNPMRSCGRTIWTSLMRATVVIGVIACLCFSAGEGLRLTPLPTLPLEEDHLSAIRPLATLSQGATRHLSGPLDRPAKGQIQKRGNRQTLECEGPPPDCFTDSPFCSTTPSSVDHQIAHTSRVSDARPLGRAPPLIS